MFRWARKTSSRSLRQYGLSPSCSHSPPQLSEATGLILGTHRQTQSQHSHSIEVCICECSCRMCGNFGACCGSTSGFGGNVQITSLFAQHCIAQQVEGKITCCSFVKGVLLDLCSTAVLSSVGLIRLFQQNTASYSVSEQFAVYHA